jgi:hypothetical protein
MKIKSKYKIFNLLQRQIKENFNDFTDFLEFFRDFKLNAFIILNFNYWNCP